MCTAIVQVPEGAGPIRLLAVRDEDPSRDWAPLGPNWPERPGIVGVKDLRAGGAWLAADPVAGRVGVLLNRAEQLATPTAAEPPSRGGLALQVAAGSALSETPATHGFNLVELAPGAAVVRSWDGRRQRVVDLTPGVHMVAHGDPGDVSAARIERWLPEFTAAAATGRDDRDWASRWVEVLHETTAEGPFADTAVVRDNAALGIPTSSLLVVLAEVDGEGARLREADLDVPGRWNELHFGQQFGAGEPVILG